MQIDTGANSSVIWHGHSTTAEPGESLTVRLGAMEATVPAGPDVLRTIERCAHGKPIGTLGNAFFERGTLVIDSVQQRLSYQPGSGLRGSKSAQRFFYANWASPGWTSPGAHIFVELQTTSFGKGYGLLDTGAAPVELGVLDEHWWTRLAGTGSTTERKITRFTVRSWGKEIECFIAPSSEEITVDNFHVPLRNIQYCPALPFQAPVRLIGIIGMHPFRTSVLTIDYPGRLWLVEESR